MFYIHQAHCISPQQTVSPVDPEQVQQPVDGKLLAIEPAYSGIPPGVLRRMGKAVRIGVGAAMPILKNNPMPAGIIIGTANCGKEDCGKFINQIVDYDEGLLTPLNFVQSTPNAIAAQIGLLTGNRGYNITHSQAGLAFEYAMIDADMLISEHPANTYLLGASDDISVYNYVLEEKEDRYKKEAVTINNFYTAASAGSIAGEGAAMFLVDGNKENALAKVIAVDTFTNPDEKAMQQQLQQFIHQHLPAGAAIDLLLSGENADSRLLKYYTACESLIQDDVTIARYKHLTGEYPTATATGLCLCCEVLQSQNLPTHLIKKGTAQTLYQYVLMYNNYKGVQHSFMLVSKA